MNRDSPYDVAFRAMTRDQRNALVDPEMGQAAGSYYGHQNEQYADEEAAFATRGPQTGPYRLIKVGIYDRNSADGRYPGVEKKNALLTALFHMMYRELLSDSDITPRFNWNGMVQGVFRTVAVGEKSAEFLRDKVEKMQPPWPGARLHVVYKSAKMPKVEGYVPGPLITVLDLYDVIRDYDRRIRTTKWQSIGVRKHNQGHVFTFNIDTDSFEKLKKCDGFIKYYEGRIEFRVLKD